MFAVLGPAVTTAVLLLIMTLDVVVLAGSWCLGLSNRSSAWDSIDRLGLVCECDQSTAETDGWFKLPVARRPRL